MNVLVVKCDKSKAGHRETPIFNALRKPAILPKANVINWFPVGVENYKNSGNQPGYFWIPLIKAKRVEIGEASQVQVGFFRTKNNNVSTFFSVYWVTKKKTTYTRFDYKDNKLCQFFKANCITPYFPVTIQSGSDLSNSSPTPSFNPHIRSALMVRRVQTFDGRKPRKLE